VVRYHTGEGVLKRKAYVTTSMAAGLLMLALFPTLGETTTIAARVRATILAVRPVDSTKTFDPTPQANATTFVWADLAEEEQYFGYQRVNGGFLNNGTPLYICRSRPSRNAANVWAIGKLYKTRCQVPWQGRELTSLGDPVLLTNNSKYQWKAAHSLSRAEIENGAVKVGWDGVSNTNLYVCRKRMSDGVHPGKYASSNGLCYVSWGGKEYYSSDDFEVLFP
jgi:hypothetical protein